MDYTDEELRRLGRDRGSLALKEAHSSRSDYLRPKAFDNEGNYKNVSDKIFMSLVHCII